MAHCVTAVLGKQSVLTALAARAQIHAPVAAQSGVWVLALNECALDALSAGAAGETIEGFIYLHPGLISKLIEASLLGWLVYVETDYFGGSGEQGALALGDGKVLYGPTQSSIGSINTTLSCVGIKKQDPATDEFESVGLHLKRHTSDWLPYAHEDEL